MQGTHDRVSTTYKGLAKDAKPGDRLLVDDGKVALVCKEVKGNDVVCEVVEGGVHAFELWAPHTAAAKRLLMSSRMWLDSTLNALD